MHRDDYPSNVQQSSPAADPWADLAEAQREVLSDVSAAAEQQRPIIEPSRRPSDEHGTFRQEERAFIHTLSQALERMRCLVWEIRLVATEQQRIVEGLCQVVQEYDQLLQQQLECTTPRDDTGGDGLTVPDRVSSA
jgi:hypothetical protein